MRSKRILLALLLLSSGASAGAPPGPVCAREEVADFVASEMRRRSPYAVTLRNTIAEWPGREPSTVWCAVTVVRQQFDSSRPTPRTVAEYQRYAVRWLDPGYEVRFGW